LHFDQWKKIKMDSRFRGNDGLSGAFSTDCAPGFALARDVEYDERSI
jgi:hypothetical protein